MQLYINNKLIVNSNKIRFKWLSPLFYNAKSFAYTFNLEFNDVNDDALNRIRFTDILASEYTFDMRIELKNIQLLGKLTITRISTVYECFFLQNSVLDLFKTTKLTSLTGNTVYYNGNTALYRGFTLLKPCLEGWDWNRDLPLKIETIEDIDFYIPCFYLWYIIELCFKKFNFRLIENCINTDTDLNKIAIINNMLAIEQSLYINPNLTFAAELSNYGNFWHISKNGENSITVDNGYICLLKNKQCVMLLEYDLNDVLINKQYNYFFINVNEQTETSSFTIDNIPPETVNYYTDGTRKYQIRLARINNKNKNLIFANHLPDLSITDFLTEIETGLGLKVLIHDNTDEFSIIKLKDVIQSNNVINISEFFSSPPRLEIKTPKGFIYKWSTDDNDLIWENVKEFPEGYTLEEQVSDYDELLTLTGNKSKDIRLVISENWYYIFTNYANNINPENSVNGFWRKYSYNFSTTVKDSDQELKIESNVSSVHNTTDLFKYYNEIGEFDSMKPFTNVKTNIALNTYTFPNYAPKAGLKLFFSRGRYTFVPTDPDIEINLNTIDVYNHFGEKIPEANLSFNMNSPYSVYEQNYKDWVYWILNYRKDATVKIEWPMHILQNIKWQQKYAINNNAFLVKSIDFECDINDNFKFYDTEIALC